jgi:hypothetical protein
MSTPRELQAQLEETQRALREAEKEIDRQRKEAAAKPPEEARALIAAISKVDLPAFWEADPVLWFRQFRTSFSRRQVRSCSRQTSERRLTLMPLTTTLHKLRRQGLLRSTEGSSVQKLRKVKVAAGIRPVGLRQPRRPPAIATATRHESTPSGK